MTGFGPDSVDVDIAETVIYVILEIPEFRVSLIVEVGYSVGSDVVEAEVEGGVVLLGLLDLLEGLGYSLIYLLRGETILVCLGGEEPVDHLSSGFEDLKLWIVIVSEYYDQPSLYVDPQPGSPADGISPSINVRILRKVVKGECLSEIGFIPVEAEDELVEGRGSEGSEES